MPEQRKLPRVFVQPAWSGVICDLCGEGEPPHQAEFWVTYRDGSRQLGTCGASATRALRIGISTERLIETGMNIEDDNEPVTEVGRKRPTSGTYRL